MHQTTGVKRRPVHTRRLTKIQSSLYPGLDGALPRGFERVNGAWHPTAPSGSPASASASSSERYQIWYHWEMDAGMILQRARQRAGLSRREAARRAGTSASTLAAYEAGRSKPSVETFQRLLGALGTQLEVSLRPSTPEEQKRAETIERLLAFADELPLKRSGPLRFPVLSEIIS